MSTAPAIPLSRHLLRVRDLIDRAYAGPLDIPALARSAHVSEAHFARSFKAAFGETPHRYLLRRRMERAKALLRAGELSVTEVCLEVGFTSLGSFSTQFRRFVGESPTAYRDREGHAAWPRCRVPGQAVHPAQRRRIGPRGALNRPVAVSVGLCGGPGVTTFTESIDHNPRFKPPRPRFNERAVLEKPPGGSCS